MERRDALEFLFLDLAVCLSFVLLSILQSRKIEKEWGWSVDKLRLLYLWLYRVLSNGPGLVLKAWDLLNTMTSTAMERP